MYYLKYLIEYEANKIEFGFTNKAGKDKVQNIVISIPILLNGEFDVEKQKEIAVVYKKVEKTKRIMQEELKKIQEYSLAT